MALIPARLGSKGLPRKNVALLGGVPLIVHSINAGLGASSVNRTIITTESTEIRDISLSHGAEVIDRPPALATDDASSADVVAHALEQLASVGQMPDYFVLLQPTSPLRTSRHVEECLETFFGSEAVSSVSVTEVEHHPYKCYLEAGTQLKPLFGLEHLDRPRQELPRIFRQNGAIYVLPTREFLESRRFHLDPMLPYIMNPEDSVDIDSALDLALAELLLQRGSSQIR